VDGRVRGIWGGMISLIVHTKYAGLKMEWDGGDLFGWLAFGKGALYDFDTICYIFLIGRFIMIHGRIGFRRTEFAQAR